MKNVFLIPTDQPSRLLKTIPKGNLILSKLTTSGSHWENQNIYITSDEDIMINDYYIAGKDIYKCLSSAELEYLSIDSYCKKIILTTDEDLIIHGVQGIDDEFLQWFVKNQSCDEVEINLNSFRECHMKGDDCFCYDTAAQSLCKLYYPNYKTIIPNLEIWKDIPKFEGYYQVSNLGNVKSLSRTILGKGKHNALLKERLLKFSTSTNGYYQVILQKEGFKKIYKVHSLVAICFLNHTPDGTHNVVIDHINEIKTDNRLENLRLIGHRENVARSMKNNTSTYVGVSWSKNAKKWQAQITIKGKSKYLGLFDNEEDANKKYLETLKDL